MSSNSILSDDGATLRDIFKAGDTMEDSDGLFYYETDYLPLKCNPDYLKLMKTLAVLCAQRTKICEDIDKLEELRQRVPQDPERVKNEIFRGHAPYIHRIDVQKVPDIDWTKYRSDIPIASNKSLRKNKTEVAKPSAPVKTEDSPSSEGKQVKVRGRVFHEKKPETFNQLWTVEEQLRLEALLIQFPPEPVENRRWKKIAEALGNRTTKQVCSRVQKYFRKLQKAGLKESSKFATTSGSSVSGKVSQCLADCAAMGELESDSDEGTYNASEQSDLSHWVKILENIAEEKKINEESGGPRVSHFGYKCGSCGENPIIGLRWECRSCPSYSSCCDCMAAMMEKSPPPHPITHHFKPYVEYVNPHYANHALGTHNYLDPNFD